MRKTYPSLSRLRALQSVCRTGSFSAAAAELLLTQPAVSTQIRQLEEETGVPLVERVGKSAKATPAGDLLIACAADMFSRFDATLQGIMEMRGEVMGRVLIGAGGTATAYLLPGILADLERRYPKVEARVSTGVTPSLVHALVDATLDVGILTAPVSDPRLAQEPFFADRLVCITPPDAEVGTGPIRPRDLSDQRLILYARGGMIRAAVDSWLAPADGSSFRILEIGDAEAQKSFVRAGFGWSIISEMSVVDEAERGLVQIVPLAPPLSRQLITVWRRDRTANPVIRATREMLSRFTDAERAHRASRASAPGV
jgi:DNA-binding transcriptional LysR family regulator